MNKLLEILITEKRPYVTSSELAEYLGLETEDVDRVIIKRVPEDIIIKSDNNDDYIIDKKIIYSIATRLPYINGSRYKNQLKILDLIRKFNYIELTNTLEKCRQGDFNMNNILERFKVEKRTEITALELAGYLGLDLGDIVSTIEKVSEQTKKFIKNENMRPIFKKENGYYTLNRDNTMYLLSDLGSITVIRYRILELIKTFYKIESEKNNQGGNKND